MIKMRHLAVLLFVFSFLSVGCSSTGSSSANSSGKSYSCSPESDKFMVECR